MNRERVITYVNFCLILLIILRNIFSYKYLHLVLDKLLSDIGSVDAISINGEQPLISDSKIRAAIELFRRLRIEEPKIFNKFNWLCNIIDTKIQILIVRDLLLSKVDQSKSLQKRQKYL